MDQLRASRIVAYALFVGLAGCIFEIGDDPSDAPPTSDPGLPDEILLTESVLLRGGMAFTSRKLETPAGEDRSEHLDAQGDPVDEVPVAERSLVEPALQELLDLPAGASGAIGPDDVLDLLFALPDPVEAYDGPEAVVEVGLDESGQPTVTIDGAPSSVDELAALQAQYVAAADDRVATLRERRGQALRDLVEAAGWTGPEVEEAVLRGDIAVRRAVTRTELEALLDAQANVLATVERWVPMEDELADAMAATNVQRWALDVGHTGDDVGIWMREAGDECPSSSSMSEGYTNLADTVADAHAEHVGNILATVAPDAHVYCDDTNFPSDPDDLDPRPWVVNHSWGQGSQSTYSTVDRDHDTAVYDEGWAAFKSAGNTGAMVTSPAKAFNVVVVGNYNDTTTAMSASSASDNPDTNVEKPDLSAPGTGVGTVQGSCSGTSCAAPHAAGFAADLLGEYSWLQGQPARLKALMMASATDNIEGDARFSDIDGAGGIDYLNAGYNGSNTVWWGDNGSHFDADGNVYTTRTFTQGQRYRVALVWLVPGTFAFAPTRYHPHGYTVNMDLDLRVTAPDGSWVAGSSSWDNAFELVDFVAPQTGPYTIRIRRFANSGTGKVNMAVHSQRVR